MTLLLVCGWLIAGSSVYAQQVQLSGYVFDSSRAVIVGARVTARNEATGVTAAAISTDEGIYRFPSLPPGLYSVLVEVSGFRSAVRTGVRLETATSAALDVTLVPGAINEDVQVLAAPKILGSRDGAVGTIVDRRFVENLPLSGKSFHSLLELTPGIVATAEGFVSSGQRGDSNYFTVDGVSANVSVGTGVTLQGSAVGQAPATTVTGGFNALASLDALEEFKVQTSSFAPEYGRTPGAQVSIVTRSGTNSYQGSFYDLVRDDALDANNWFTNRNGLAGPELRQHSFSAVVGGPLMRDRLFFFSSYEGLRLRLPKVIVDSVPSLAARAQANAVVRPFLESFPQPTATDETNFMSPYAVSLSDKISSDIIAGRVDYAWRPGTQIFGRYEHAPSETETQNVMTTLPLQLRFRTLTAGVTRVWHNAFLADIRANVTDNDVHNASTIIARNNASGFPSAWLPTDLDYRNGAVIYTLATTRFNATQGAVANNRQRQFNLVGAVTLGRRTHQFKVGFDQRFLQPKLEPRAHELSVRFDTVQQLLAGMAASVTARRSQPVRGTVYNGSIFVQDTWHPWTSTTFTYGLRWDVNPPPSFTDGDAPLAVTQVHDVGSLEFAQRGSSLWKTEYGNVSPRVGVSHALGSSGRLVLNGGIGLFRDLGSQTTTTLWGGGVYPTTVQQAFTNVSLPLPYDSLQPPASASLRPPYSGLIAVVNPDLRTPTTVHWNVRGEYSLSSGQAVWIGYVGASGNDLLTTSVHRAPNPSFPGLVYVIGNDGESSYHAMETQYRLRASRGLQVTASYTLSQTRDNASSGFTIRVPSQFGITNEWGAANFDVRHVVTGAISWTSSNSVAGWRGALLRDWGIDTLFRVRSSPPMTVNTGRDAFGLILTNFQRPNLVSGASIYIDDPTAPGGRRLNRDAFVIPPTGTQGTLGRNSIRGFPGRQIDLGVRRSWPIVRRLRMQLRVDLFNVLNTSNFGPPTASMSSATFGVATATLNNTIGTINSLYQWGGPRSVEVGLRFTF